MGSEDPFSPETRAAICKTSPVEPRVQRHLVRVYRTIAGAVASTAAGTSLYAWQAPGSILRTSLSIHLLGIAALLYLVGLIRQPGHTPQQRQRRWLVFQVFAFFEGLSMGQIIQTTTAVDPGTLAIALIMAVMLFICFSGGAMMSRRRHYMYLGSILSSALSMLFVMLLFSVVFHSETLFTIELYAGLLMAALFILFETQVIIERASSDPDISTREPVQDSLGLFMDFISVFRHILIILLRKKMMKDRKDRSDD